MRAFDLDPNKRWLFCMTHPDDEISICAWIHRLVQNGNDVFMSWTHSNPIREREARAAAHLLGVPQENLYFFSATDGGACDEIPELLPQFRELMKVVKPDRVVCGAFEQGHIDHDSTNYLVNHSFDGDVFEVPLYHTYVSPLQRLNRFSDRTGEEVLQLSPAEQRLKKTVARQYPSQNIYSILFWHEVCSKARIKPPLPYSERMRLQQHRAWLAPNHPPKLAKRVTKCAGWRRWVAAVVAAEARILIGSQSVPDEQTVTEVEAALGR